MDRTLFKDRKSAEAVMGTLPPFEPSKYLTKFEVEQGRGVARIVEFRRGFAIQLGEYGNYYPSTMADAASNASNSP